MSMLQQWTKQKPSQLGVLGIFLPAAFTLVAMHSTSANAQNFTGSYTNANGATVSFSTNDTGRLVYVQDARGVLTMYQYDLSNNLISENSPERGQLIYEFDDSGKMDRQISSDGLIRKFTYDDQGRLVKEVFKQNGVDRKVNRAIYDDCENGEGRICKVVSDGHVTKFSYSTEGKPAKTATRYAGETKFQTTKYSYDAEGRAFKLRYPTGLIVRYHFNSDDYVTKITGRYETGEETESFIIAKNIQYDPANQRLSNLSFGNGLSSSFSYDENSLPESIIINNGSEVVDHSTYVRSEDGKIESIIGLDSNDVRSFEYDQHGHLKLELKGAEQASQSLIAYTYDAVGNRLTRTKTNEQDSYAYPTDANQLAQVNNKAFEYDNRGNLVSSRNGKHEFVYDVTNRLAEYSKNGELKATYDYNAFGQRILKTRLHSTQGENSYKSLQFAYTPDGWLLSELGSNEDKKKVFARDYVWLGARPIAQIQRRIREDGTTKKSEISYLHTDHLNTPRRATNQVGEVVWRWESDAFGEGKAQRDPDADGKKTIIRLRFPGQYYDGETGLHYNHRRDYDPSLGRYIQSDPIGLQGGANRYAYATSDPINHIDPKGLNTTIVNRCYTTEIYSNGGWVPGSSMPDGCDTVIMETPGFEGIGDYFTADGVLQLISIAGNFGHWLFTTEGYHNYDTENTVCDNASAVPQGDWDDVMARFTVPTNNPQPVSHGSINLVRIPSNGIRGGWVQTTFSNGGHTGTNQTTIFHLLHNGSVSRTISSSGGGLIVTTTGQGTNYNMFLGILNQVTGAGIFNGLDGLMRDYMTANYPACGNN